MISVLTVIFIFACWIVPFWMAGLMIWAYGFLAIGAIIVAGEIASILRGQKTLTKMFYDFSEIHPRWAWTILGFLFLGWLILLIHLAWHLLS